MAPTRNGAPEDAPPAELNLTDADDVTRDSFRSHVTDADHITVQIAGQRHALVDVGSHGIGILLAEGTVLVPGQTHDLLLTLGNQTLALRGLVRHVTKDDEANAFHCGIELVDLTLPAAQQLQEFVLRQRRNFFPHPSA